MTTSKISSVQEPVVIVQSNGTKPLPSIYSNNIQIYTVSSQTEPNCNVSSDTASEENLLKNKVQSVCEKYGIEFNRINESSYENFLKAAEYVKNHPNELDNKKGKITSPADKILHYMTALNYKWDCIEDFVKANTVNNSDNLIERLIRTKCLTKKNNYTDADIKDACTKYYKKAILSAKAERTKDMTAKEADEWEVKFCSQDFSKLLINTRNSKYAKYLKAMISSLSPENIDKALNTVNENNANKNAEQQIDIFEFLKDEDIYLNASSKTIRLIASNMNDKQANATISEKDNKIIEKYAKLLEDEQQGKIKLTDEQRKKYQKYLENNSALKMGYRDSKNATEEEKIITLAESEERIQNGSTIIYKDEIKARAKFISENIPQEEQERYVNFFNKVSNGNYSKVLENPNCELNPPADVKKLAEGAQADLGLKQETKPEQAEVNAQNLSAQIEEQTQEGENTSQILVEKEVLKNPKLFLNSSGSKSKKSVSIAEKFANLTQLPVVEIIKNTEFSIEECIKNNIIKFEEAIKNFGNLAKSDQQSIERNHLDTKSKAEQEYYVQMINEKSIQTNLAIKYGLSNIETDSCSKQKIEQTVGKKDIA